MESQAALEGPYFLSGSATAYTVADLYPAILDYLDRRPHPVIDLSGLEDMDTLGLQLLLATRKSAQRRGIPLAFQSIPAAVEACCEDRGLSLEAFSS